VKIYYEEGKGPKEAKIVEGEGSDQSEIKSDKLSIERE